MPDTRPTLRRSLARTTNRIRIRGLGEVAGLGWQRVLEALSSEDTLVVFTRPSGGSVEPPEGLTFREATAQDAHSYARDIGTDSPYSFAARLSPATRCFVVTRGDLIVHSSWVTTAAAWTREIRGYMTPPPGAAYVYESFTRPEVRGRGVYPFALRSICSWASTIGIEQVWVAVEADNPASLKAVAKAGFEPAFRFSYRRRIVRLTIEPPTGQMAHIGISFVSGTD